MTCVQKLIVIPTAVVNVPLPISQYVVMLVQGEVVVTVSALDGDRGVDDSVFYSLEDDGNSLIGGEVSFVIGNETGEISVNVTSLDRETHTSYTLTVKVGALEHSWFWYDYR